MTEAQSNSNGFPVEQEKKIIDQLADTAFETEKKDNLSFFINNLKVYCSVLIQKSADQFQISKFKYLLQNQISDVWFEEPLKDFRILVQQAKNNIEGYPLYKNLSNFEEICRELIKMKTEAENQEAYDRAQAIIQGFFKEVQQIIEDSQTTIEKFNTYDVYGNDQDEEEQSQVQEKGEEDQQEQEQELELENEGQEQKEKHKKRQKEQQKEKVKVLGQEKDFLASDHFQKQVINTKIDFGPSVFSWVSPLLHKVYISEACKAYNEIVPFRIKTIIPNSTQSPTINVQNYFAQGLEDNKAIIAYCIPGTINVGYYQMNDICRISTMQAEYYQERTLSNEWVFSEYTRSVTTPGGIMFAINSRTTNQKIDSCMYEITDVKASNRGPLPSPKRQSSFIYLNSHLYVIGGYGQGEKCSNKNYRYNIRDKKWSRISESNVSLKKPTLCALSNRYLLKMGGLNEFDYINKVVEIYDTMTDKWSLVRATPRTINQEIQILQDSLAVQINDDQIYIFGGKNSNKYSSDKGFILQITEIKERKKGAAKVNAELWNVSVGKRNLLTFFGAYSPCNVVVHFNCVYFLRVKYTQALSI